MTEQQHDALAAALCTFGLVLLAAILAALLSSCRVAGQAVILRDSPGAVVRIDGTRIDAEQGKATDLAAEVTP